jgi:phage shock protein C
MSAYVSNARCGLSRDADRALVAGVCAGLARHFGFNLRVTRVLAVIAFLTAMPFFLVAYTIAVIVLPSQSSGDEYVVERIVRRRRHRRKSRREWHGEEDVDVARREAEVQVAERARALEERLARIEKHITSSRYRLEEEFGKL